MLNFICIVSNPKTFGNGHKTRQEVLKKEIEQQGHRYEIVLNNQDLEKIEIINGSILILDLSNRDIEPTEQFFKNFEKSVGFDWSGFFTPDVNIVVLEHPEHKYKFKKMKHVGLKYFIINDKFYRKDFQNSKEDFIVISLGFSCKSSMIIEAISKVRRFSKDPIIITTGVHLSIPNFENVKIMVNPLNYHELILDAKLVVSNGGTTMIESLSAGKEVIPLPQNLDESRFLHEVCKFASESSNFPGAIKMNEELNSETELDSNGMQRVVDVLLGEL